MKLLHIDSSILGDNSASRQLSREVVKAWQAADPSVEVSYRDLASEGIQHFRRRLWWLRVHPLNCGMRRKN